MTTQFAFFYHDSDFKNHSGASFSHTNTKINNGL